MAHPGWRKALTTDTSAGARGCSTGLRGWEKCLSVNSSGVKSRLYFIVRSLSNSYSSRTKMWADYKSPFSKVSLGQFSLSAKVQRGPAPTAPETQRKLSWLSFVCTARLTVRTMPSAAIEPEAAETAGWTTHSQTRSYNRTENKMCVHSRVEWDGSGTGGLRVDWCSFTWSFKIENGDRLS